MTKYSSTTNESLMPLTSTVHKISISANMPFVYVIHSSKHSYIPLQSREHVSHLDMVL